MENHGNAFRFRYVHDARAGSGSLMTLTIDLRGEFHRQERSYAFAVQTMVAEVPSYRVVSVPTLCHATSCVRWRRFTHTPTYI